MLIIVRGFIELPEESESEIDSMNHLEQVSFDNYTRAGDVAVMALCVVTVILLLTSYVSRTRAYRIFTNIIGSLFFAALVNIGYHCLLTANNPSTYTLIYVMRIL